MAITTKARATTTMQGWHLTYQQGTSNKFYDVFLGEEGWVIMHWGRIGSAGTCKVEKMDYTSAHDIAMRQVYSKAAKGYETKISAFAFQVEVSTLQQAADTQYVAKLQAVFAAAQRDGKFSGDKELVFKHYDTFIEQAERLMSKAATLDIGEVMDEWAQIQAAFAEISAKHDTALTTLGLTEQMVTKKLLGGT